MNISLIIIAILLIIGIYCILAAVLKLPTFRSAGNIGRMKRVTRKAKTGSGMIQVLTNALAPHIPMNMMQEIKLQQLLSAAEVNQSPRQHRAYSIVVCGIVILPFLLLSLLTPFFLLVAVGVGIFTLFFLNARLKEQAANRARNVEQELPQFISNVAAAIRSQHDIIEIFASYRMNYDTPLTHELAITIADMRTGTPERALERLAVRINLPLMTELVRTILAIMQGEDMSVRFNAIIQKAKNQRQEALHEKILSLNPKISRISMLLTLWQLGSLIVLVLYVAFSSISSFGGLL